MQRVSYSVLLHLSSVTRPPIKGTVAVKRDAVSAVQGHCCAELSIKATICGLCSLGEVHSKLLYVKVPFVSDNCMLRFQSSYLKL